jgi:hypothetical protein
MTKPKVLFLVTDNVDGMLIGEVTPSWFHNGLTAITHMAYAREGANGLPLLREFLKWARSWDAVRKIQVSTSFSGERGERAERLIERLGLSPVGKQFVEIR